MNTFHIIDGIVKISPRAQHEVLKYKKGKETIELLNSFLGKLGDLKKLLAKRYSEYSAVNHFENALEKQKNIEELKKNIVDVEKKIESITEERKKKGELLGEKTKNLENIESKLSRDKIKNLKDQINSLNEEIKTMESKLKINLLIAGRAISRILHSSDNKIFNFFTKNFVRHPLENINEGFWQMVDIVKKKDIDLDETENKNLNSFLSFVENELKDKIVKYKNLEAEKIELKEALEKLSSENKELLKKVKDEEKNVEEEFKIVNRRLEKFEKERNNLQALFRKNIKVLEIMIKKASGNRIRIKV